MTGSRKSQLPAHYAYVDQLWIPVLLISDAMRVLRVGDPGPDFAETLNTTREYLDLLRSWVERYPQGSKEALAGLEQRLESLSSPLSMNRMGQEAAKVELAGRLADLGQRFVNAASGLKPSGG